MVSGQSSVYSPISISPALVVILTTVGMEVGAFTGTRAYVCRPTPSKVSDVCFRFLENLHEFLVAEFFVQIILNVVIDVDILDVKLPFFLSLIHI